MEYATAVPFHGDQDKAFDLAITALSALGFRLDHRTADSARLTGPGMNSSRQSPLVGASKLELSARRGELALAAELGGAERLMRFVRIFPIALNVGLGLMFFAIFSVTLGQRVGAGAWMTPVVAVVLINAAVWAFLGPWMARLIHQRTCKGLETLLSSMVTAGEATSAKP
jgi:hypothetical protein